MRIALLSNINVNGIIRLLKENVNIYEVEGYGNELATLLNSEANLYKYEPDMIFVVEDIQELIRHTTKIEEAKKYIKNWFTQIESTIKDKIIYYISDAYCYGVEIKTLADVSIKENLEHIWDEELTNLIKRKDNIRILPYKKIIQEQGEQNSFSRKTWYMGKILYSCLLQKQIASAILKKINEETYVPKKVLLLDLDNTLWGGLAGEEGKERVLLSDDALGLVYKDFQRVVLQMKEQGTVLGIVSKNNFEDAMDIIINHPHMVLKDEDFAIKRINWRNKNDNIQDISRELNVGLDSIVYIDDSPQERQLIVDTLPQVVVPNFPEQKEKLPDFMVEIWSEYFQKPRMTEEDKSKTAQYKANSARRELEKASNTYEEYLKGLNIILSRVDNQIYVERITQLINKCNQFNLTTIRHTRKEIENYLSSKLYKVYAYNVADKFGDCGVTAVVILNFEKKLPMIQEFVMSCRVMGKNIEVGIIDDIERELIDNGFEGIEAKYIKSEKNMPVSDFYEKMGYTLIEKKCGQKKYKMMFNNLPMRNIFLKNNF